MIEKIDIFGISPSLYFQGKAHYQTKCGSILTLLTGVAIVFSFIFYGREMFVKENPQTVFSEEFIRQPEMYSFEKNKNSIAISLQNFAMSEEYPNFHFIDESVYSMKFFMKKRVKIINKDTGKEEIENQQHEIPIRPCIDSDFQVQGTEKSFRSLPFKNDLYCIDDYDAQPIEIEGDFGQEVQSIVTIRAYECRNSTENGNSCKSQEEIDRHLESQYWSIYFTDQLINPKNYTHPFQFIDRDLYSVSSNKEHNQYLLRFQNMYVESDTGLLWSSKELKRGLQLSSEAHQTYKNPKDNGEFLKIEIRFEKFKQQRIFRSYVNLGEVIAQVGGLSKMVLMTFWLFSYLFVQRDYTIRVLNKLYNFNQEEPTLRKKDREPTIIKEKEIQSHMQLQNISLDISQAYNIDENYKDRLLSFFKKMFARLKISALQSYLYPIYNQDVKKNQKLLRQATQKLYSNLDVVRILTKLQEVDKLKELLLNTEQKQLFEYIPKPLIKEEKENKEEYQRQDSLHARIYNEDEEEFQKIQAAFRAYKKIQARNSKSNVDYKIMDLLDRKVRTYFDQIYKQNESKPYKAKINHNGNRTQEVSCNSSMQKLSSGSDDKNLENKDTTDFNVLASNIVTKNIYNNNKGQTTSEENQVIEIDDKETRQTLIKFKQMMTQMHKQIQVLIYGLNELKLKYIENSNSIQKNSIIKSNINNDEIENKVISLEQLDIDIPTNSRRIQAQNSNTSRNKNNNLTKTRDGYHSKLVLQQAQSFDNLHDLQYRSQTSRNNSVIIQTPKGDHNFLIHQQ